MTEQKNSSNRQESNENKQWLVSRIENFMDAYHQGLVSNKEKFEKVNESYLSSIRRIRNEIIISIGIIAPLLLSIISTDLISDSIRLILFQLIFYVLLFGGVTYLITSIITRKASILFLKVEKCYLEALTAQNFLSGYLALRTFNLHEISVAQLNILTIYLRILEAAMTCSIINESTEILQHRIFRIPFIKWTTEQDTVIKKLYDGVIRNALYLRSLKDSKGKDLLEGHELSAIFDEEGKQFFNTLNGYLLHLAKWDDRNKLACHT